MTRSPARWRRPTVAATATVAVLVAGCTSTTTDDARRAATEQDDGPPREQTRTFASAYTQATTDFEAQVDAVKDRGRAALEAGDDEEVVAVYRDLLEATRTAHDRYGDLEPPAGLDLPLDRLRDQLDAQVEVLTSILEAAEAGDEPAVISGLQELATLMVDWSNTHRAVVRRLPPDET